MSDNPFDVEPTLVMCHTFFNDAFRTYPEFKLENYENQQSSQFIARFIIEKQSELQEGQFVSFTSKKIFDEFIEKFNLETHDGQKYEMVEILENMIYVVDNEAINKLDLDESAFAIGDILFSRSTRRPVILVSNMKKKIEKALEFYKKSDPRIKEPPFEIFTTDSTEGFLRGRYPDICRKIDERMKKV